VGFTRTICRKAEPLESPDWERSTQTAQLMTEEGNSYAGTVLRSKVAEAHEISLRVRTSPTRKSELRIPIWVDRAATAKVWVNGTSVGTSALVGKIEGRLPLTAIRVEDVTDQTEGRQYSEVRLWIAHDQGEGVAFVPLPGGDVAPAIRQRWLASYTLPAGLFFAFAYAAVALAAVALPVELRAWLPIEARLGWGKFAEAVAVAVPLFSVAKWPMRLPVAATIRRAYGAWRSARSVVLAILLLLIACGMLSLLEYRQIYGLQLRLRYTHFVRQYEGMSSDDALQEAFAIVPERVEVPFLLTRHEALQFSVANTPNRKVQYSGRERWVAALTAHNSLITKGVKLAMNRSWCQRWLLPIAPNDAREHWQDPVVWYAALLPSAVYTRKPDRNASPADRRRQCKEYLRQVNQFLKRLKGAQAMLTLDDRLDATRHRRDGPTERTLLRLVLRSNQLDYECDVLHESLEKERRTTDAEMENIVNAVMGHPSSLEESHFYQECCDLLMQKYERTDVDKARDYAEVILRCRKQRSDQRLHRQRPLPWMRYPEKLQLCQYFILGEKPPKGFSRKLDKLLDNNAEYRDYRARNPSEVPRAKLAWWQNTPRDKDPELSLKSIDEVWLSEGWRY
jgi:hypothetical protein